MKKAILTAVVFLSFCIISTYAAEIDTNKSNSSTYGVVSNKNDDSTDSKSNINKLEERIVVLEKRLAELEQNSNVRIFSEARFTALEKRLAELEKNREGGIILVNGNKKPAIHQHPSGFQHADDNPVSGNINPAIQTINK